MQTAETIAILRLPHAHNLPLPTYQSIGAAGMDLLAALAADSPLTLQPGARCIVPTGISIALPLHLEAQVRPRSGLAAKHGITVLNAPGTIDSDYRGEVGVILINLGEEAVIIRRGDRIAQLVVAPFIRVQWEMCEQLPGTDRAADGFGSTGR